MAAKRLQVPAPVPITTYVLNDPTDSGPIGFVSIAPIAPGWSVAMTFHHNEQAGTVDLMGLSIFDDTRPAPIGHPQQQHWMATPALTSTAQASWATWITTDSLTGYPKPAPAIRPTLSRAMLRSLPLAYYEQGARHLAAELDDVRHMFAGADVPPQITARVGRKRLDDHYYATLARAYLDLHNAGDPHPRDTLANRNNVSSATIRDHLARARQRGLLISAGRGKAGGTLSGRARQLLDDAS